MDFSLLIALLSEMDIHKKYGNYVCQRLDEELPAPLPKPLTRVEERKALREEKESLLQLLGVQ